MMNTQALFAKGLKMTKLSHLKMIYLGYQLFIESFF